MKPDERDFCSNEDMSDWKFENEENRLSREKTCKNGIAKMHLTIRALNS